MVDKASKAKKLGGDIATEFREHYLTDSGNPDEFNNDPGLGEEYLVESAERILRRIRDEDPDYGDTYEFDDIKQTATDVKRDLDVVLSQVKKDKNHDFAMLERHIVDLT